MATSAKQQQNKREKNKRKRKLAQKAISPASKAEKILANLVNYPVYECWVPDFLFDLGKASVIVSRLMPSGDIAVSAFIVDPFCLGVKDAFFKVVSKSYYKNTLCSGINGMDSGASLTPVSSAYARKLIEDAIGYAKNLGFSPHRDYQQAKRIFGDIDVGRCEQEFTFGVDGKPLYVIGPYDSPVFVRRVIQTLEQKCGEGHFSVVSGHDFTGR